MNRRQLFGIFGIGLGAIPLKAKAAEGPTTLFGGHHCGAQPRNDGQHTHEWRYSSSDPEHKHMMTAAAASLSEQLQRSPGLDV